MIITFCGHADFFRTEEREQQLLAILENRIGSENADVYLGDCGSFDSFAYSCCKKYQQMHPNIKLVFVTPYMTEEYLKSRREKYDEVIYPELERKPKKFAISYRNKYTVESADLVIAFVTRTYGGAYAAYKHASKKSKEIINLATIK